MPKAIMPKVSVVIPAYNAMTFLPETLKSVSKQTLQDYEIIVVNDGSTDDIDVWMTQITDSRVKLISQANQGASVARNTGIEKSQGHYIAFLDADDLWEPTKLEKQVQILDQNPQVGLAYTWVALIDSQDKFTGKVWEYDLEGDVWETLIEHNIIETSSTAMVRRSCLDIVGLFDTTISKGGAGSEDWEMWLRIAGQYSFKGVPEPLTYYRTHASNGSKNWAMMENDYHLILEKTFAKAPAYRQHLKSRSYGFANLRIAWKALQNLDGNCEIAVSYRAKAVAAYPAIRWGNEYLRFSLALSLVQAFGLNGYSQLRESLYWLKESFLKFPQRLLVPNK